MREIDAIRPRARGRVAVDMVVPDYYVRRSKSCLGSWGRRSLNVTPNGRVLPCHAAETILALVSWSVKDHP
jgi:pyrroloquinoline quinone biosynthesis protein E